jgi:hypothetical protein
MLAHVREGSRKAWGVMNGPFPRNPARGTNSLTSDLPPHWRL